MTTTNTQAVEFLRRVRKYKEREPSYDLFAAVGGVLSDPWPQCEVTDPVWRALECAASLNKGQLDWKWVGTLTHAEDLAIIDLAIKELEDGR